MGKNRLMFKNKVKCGSCYETDFNYSDEMAKVGDTTSHSYYHCFKDTTLIIMVGIKQFVIPTCN